MKRLILVIVTLFIFGACNTRITYAIEKTYEKDLKESYMVEEVFLLESKKDNKEINVVLDNQLVMGNLILVHKWYEDGKLLVEEMKVSGKNYNEILKLKKGKNHIDIKVEGQRVEGSLRVKVEKRMLFSQVEVKPINNL